MIIQPIVHGSCSGGLGDSQALDLRPSQRAQIEDRNHLVEGDRMSAEDAVHIFITKHHCTDGCTEDLLRLVKYLTSADMISSTRLLPLTRHTMLQHLHRQHPTLVDRVNVHHIQAAAGEIVEVFPHLSLQTVIADLLLEPVAKGDQYFEFCQQQPADDCVNELWSAGWWREAELRASRACPGARVLSIIFYIDGVSVDFFGNIHMIPIMITFGNYSLATRRSHNVKRVVGFLPHLPDEDIASRTRADVSRVRRELMHNAFQVYVDVLNMMP